ncbi:septum site-determining protein MinC [Evansella vedderi]|uniref:Probable septum site-determining protein MinC n=1 Tax=Evansella vedderi TaxID=38282 RepID=A0ABT9ZZ34_9BACI|nr:septum site-determining protein MinC [Evansella vedderi]MDQ0256516.1 septum site-determining protein MinC [Evansella vedderi]
MAQKQIKKQNVLIKGTKDGLTFFLNDQCSFDSLITELQDKLSERPTTLENEGGFVRVKVVAGKRYLHENQVELLEKTLYEFIQGVIVTIESDVITKEEAEEIRKSYEVNRLVKVVRSGQVVEVDGDLLLIGDVNPGGTVKATGNIFVMGKLLGMAHAGIMGNSNAVICAASMLPTQLRIGESIQEWTEKEKASIRIMGCAYVNDTGDMLIGRVQNLLTTRPDVSILFENEN